MSSSESNDEFFSCSSDSEEFVDAQPGILLGDILHNTFSSFQNNLNVCHINAQSIPCHYPDLLTTFYSQHIHAVLVSETFLKPTLQSTSFSLPGFTLLRNDRTGRGGGGVGIYIRSHLKYNIVSQSASFYSGSAEHIFIELNLSSKKFLLGVVYAPPTIDYFGVLEHLLETHLPCYDNSLIMGDFNTCLNKDDYRSRKLKLLTSSANCTILPLNPTYHIHQCNSLLDLILTPNSCKIASHGQHPASGFSNHDLIFASYKLKTQKFKPKVILQRNLSKMDVEALRSDAINVDWQRVELAETPDEKVAEFNRLIIALYDKHAPIHPVRMKRPPAPWLDDDIRATMKRRNRLNLKYKRNPSEINWDNFKSARNRVNQMCRNAKRKFIHKSIEDASPQTMWRFLKSLDIGKNKSNSNISSDLNGLNNYFASLSGSIDPILKLNTITSFESIPLPLHDAFTLEPCTVSETKKIFTSLTTKAVGHDNIGRSLLFPLLDVVLLPITNIVNCSLASGIFPDTWKKSFVVPIPKKSAPTELSHYRPISVLPFLSKVIEVTVHRQLSTFLQKNTLLNPYQSGFRSSYSTSTALIKVTDDLRESVDNGKLSLVALLDFSCAFNCVDFDILLSILRTLNISNTTYQWFRSYLHGRQQCIRQDDLCSDWCTLTAGVPQGGSLSPLLFSIFINCITSSLNFSSYHLYADDIQLYLNFKLGDVSDAFSNMNSDLENVSLFAHKLGLNLNAAKTQVMVTGTRQAINKLDMSVLPPLILNGTKLTLSPFVKDLGVFINSDLTWNKQVGEVSRKIFAAMHSLKRYQNFLPISTKLTLVNSLLIPIIDYADVCYPDISEELLNKLDRLLNLCIRYVYGLRKFDHISDYRNQLNWLSIRHRRTLHLLTLLYKILNNPNSPPYLRDRFQFLCDSHTRQLRSAVNNQLTIPLHNSAKYADSFTVTAARQWNMLPVTIRNVHTVTAFKKSLFQHLLIKQKNT